MFTANKLAGDLDFASAEAYNLLRTNIMFSLPGKKNCGKLMGVSSPNPQDGKSFTSINLSYSLAKDGQRVLLIDGDMRRPSIARVLSMPCAPGLSNLLIGGERESIVHTGVLNENLDVVFAGDIPPNPSELIGSEKMKELLDEFAADYDFVIVDLPPVNAVADPLIISKLLDGIVLVIRHNYTKKKNIREAVRQLKFAEVNILGFVYNGFSRGSGYYKKGGRYYKHYYSSEKHG